MGLIKKLFGSYSERELKRVYPIQQKVLALEETYKSKSDAELKAATQALKERLANGETLDDILPDAFAVCREASDRVLGMRHFPVQIIGGIILHQGRISEMRTGEGKTLVATLPAYLNALTGKGVHIVTVNDYLAKRDSEWMGKVYRFLGLSVGLIIHGLDTQQRRDAYACDITYGTNNEFGFDYLRDNMVIYKRDKVQRGHNYAIVDEVDSILIDEARTPLIISGQGDKSTDLYERADRFARTLKCYRVAETDSKEEHDDVDGDYIVDEKAKTVTLTASGVAKAEEYFGLENLTDGDNMQIQHHINQAIRAHGIMQRDVDYVVKDGEVIIVDEYTGRLMLGRRYNEGLHQAIEAKEGVKVERESKTLATVTFQNFFRMYDKLAGMTGTAMTEADEFMEIYKLDVIEIPTNKPVQRIDHHDVVYKTEKAKFNAVIENIVECHEKGQPVLVGTISIEKSELLSGMLKRRGIKHEVLNAKYHEKEAEIVAQAGQYGAVTIATNMAGRGTDIMLGGNAEYMAKAQLRKAGYDDEVISEATGFADTDDEQVCEARRMFRELMDKYRAEISTEAEKVRAAGGLFIIGTERHESRRIDNQLRGRAGRQGDPGETRFFMSLEDDLMRLFGGERIQNMMNMIGADDDMPIEAKILTNSIESAQAKVEARNFGIRKNVLQFDDVMNRQREIIYSQRDKVLDGEDISGIIKNMIKETIDSTVDRYLVDKEVHDNWNLEGLRDYFLGWLTTQEDLRYTTEQLGEVTDQQIKDMLNDRAEKIYAAREAQFTSPITREIERVVLLRNVDMKWMQHIDDMEELKRGMHLRGYAQKDPVIEYRIEGFDMFDAMIESIREDTVKMMFTIRLRTNEEPKREQVAKPAQESRGESDGTLENRPRTVKKVGRNDPCPCGSGKKYKKCCGRDAE
ncbi:MULTISPECIES: preprotein translocase subunit SecA [Anaerotruncus]|jgi:preprotein translocase subunit SecA|uniref:Protein translocase subunit SecA n=1 Tax=Anaerotruncus colihominis TaxID=169435 RepID=A0A845T0A6_9FIRM|nr:MULTISPECIES: preprotein translocase subunit SecA [Anaerotruncus]MCI8491932.1 preprotein translocase subunit SecA [Anaerotruncus sp.]MCR2026406.1 preprotein translocase subunit SecA [Anaerotruncus colihominis]NBI79755.1 preprotein translocase subunit SecA [Anaerotruncus colihominis]NDO40608.1 preprotein translocase subunit SecA [Anaerotruncus colihominis]